MPSDKKKASSEMSEVAFNPTENSNDVTEFLREVEEIREWVSAIEKYSIKIDEAHNEKLSAVSELEGTQTNEELDDLNFRLNSLANKTRKKIKELDERVKKSQTNDSIHRIYSQQVAHATQMFMDAMSGYNQIQCKFKEKYRERVKRQYRIVKPDVTDEEVDLALQSQAGDSIFANQILSSGHQEAKAALEEIKDRHEEILKLEKSIKELHDMFLDMALLIERQGEMIDHIELNVGEAVDYTEGARVELVQAVKHYRSAMKWKFIFIAIGVVVLIAIGLGIYFAVKK